MTDDEGFIRAVQATPGDDLPRLVYADWLDERNDPRGTFLRLDVALHATDPHSRPADLRKQLQQARLNLDARWLAQVERPLGGWRLVRKGDSATTYGKAIPAFIHNGTYFLSPVEVYADGSINCWGYNDVPLFRDKLASGWVATRPAVGGTIGIHNLGQAVVAAVEWDRTATDFAGEVMAALRELNPSMHGLIDMEGTDTEVRDGMRYAKGYGWGQGKLYRVNADGDEVLGDDLSVFEVIPGGLRLRNWLIYADGLSQLGYGTASMPLDAVGVMFAAGRLTLAVPAGTWVAIDGLGQFRAGEGYWFIQPGERMREAADMVDQLQGGEGAIRRCIRAHQDYRADPSDGRREVLRRAYEAVPEHLRMYCGDMDSKDHDIRRILFGEPEEADEEE